MPSREITPEEEAVIEAEVEFHTTSSREAEIALNAAVKALIESRKPKPVVFPDPPTDYPRWQHINGHISTALHDDDPEWRQLRVTYTPMDEPAPLERIAELEAEVARLKDPTDWLWGVDYEGTVISYSEGHARDHAQFDPLRRKLVRIQVHEVD